MRKEPFGAPFFMLRSSSIKPVKYNYLTGLMELSIIHWSKGAGGIFCRIGISFFSALGTGIFLMYTDL